MVGNQGEEMTRLYTGRGLYMHLDSPCGGHSEEAVTLYPLYHRERRMVAAIVKSALSVDTMVYHAGFEPAAFCSQSRRATKLR